MENKAFDDIKYAVSRDTLLEYTDLNNINDIHTDAKNYNIGAVIRYDGKLIAFYSRKLEGPKMRYKVTEKD